MSSAVRAKEPSMDEILASIRRIIEGNEADAEEGLDPAVAENHASAVDAEPKAGVGEPFDTSIDPDVAGIESLDLPMWPEGPGEPANDRTATLARLRPRFDADETRAIEDPGRGEDRSETHHASSLAEAPRTVGPDLRRSASTGALKSPDLKSPEEVSSDDDAFDKILSDRSEALPIGPHVEAEAIASNSASQTQEPMEADASAISAGDLRFDVHPSDGEAVPLSTPRDVVFDLSPMVEVEDAGETAIALSEEAIEETIADARRSMRVARAGPFEANVPAGDAIGSLGKAEETSSGQPLETEDGEAPTDFYFEFDEDEFANALLDRVDLVEDVDISEDEEMRVSDPHDDPGRSERVETGKAGLDPEASKTVQPKENGLVAAFDDPGDRKADGTPTRSSGDAPLEHGGQAMHRLISNEVEERVSQSFGHLALALRDDQMRSIDETVRDMLRPMLHEWLDDNLPHMVERLVREEIERVARGGRR